MKKFIIAIAAIFVAYSAQAQIGIMAGLTSSKTDWEAAVADVENINQYHIGIAYKMGLGNLVTIQPAILYNVKGTQVDQLAGVKDFEMEAETGYIEIPVQLQVGLGLGPIARVYGFVEPYVGFAVSNKLDMDYGDILDFDEKETWDNIKNKFNYGVSLGVGAEVLKHVQVSVKYFWDMGEVYGFKDIEAVAGKMESTKCNGVAASVAFFF